MKIVGKVLYLRMRRRGKFRNQNNSPYWKILIGRHLGKWTDFLVILLSRQINRSATKDFPAIFQQCRGNTSDSSADEWTRKLLLDGLWFFWDQA